MMDPAVPRELVTCFHSTAASFQIIYRDRKHLRRTLLGIFVPFGNSRLVCLLLVPALLLSVSGCLFFGINGGGSGYTLHLEPVGDDLGPAVAVAADERTAAQTQAVQTAIKNGSMTTYGHRPFENGTYVAVSGSYYRISVVDTPAATQTKLTLHGEIINESAVEGGAVNVETAMEGSPVADKRALKFALASAWGPTEQNASAEKKSEAADEFFYIFHHPDPDASALLPGPKYEYIKYNEQYIRLVVEEHTIVEDGYRTTVTQVATSSSEFERYAQRQLVSANLDTAPLSATERQIIENATGDGYDEARPFSAAYNSTLERIGVIYTNGTRVGRYGPRHSRYVRYNDTYYRIRVSSWAAD